MENNTLSQQVSNISPNVITLIKIWFKSKIYEWITDIEWNIYSSIWYIIEWINMSIEFNPETTSLNWYMRTTIWDGSNNISLKIQSLDDLDKLLTILQIKHITIV